MSSADLVSLEDTPLAFNASHDQQGAGQLSLLDTMQSEQTQLDTPALPVLSTSTTTTASERTALKLKTSIQRRSVDFHPSISSVTSSPLSSPRHAKRQSMSFPVNVAPSYYPSTHYSQLRSPIQHTRTASESAPAAPVSDQVEPASDPITFLTVLAGQERRVLELKEELLRADAELEKLKRKWAMHEATRKRSESSTVEQMRSLEIADETKKHVRRQSTGLSRSGSKRTATFNDNTKHQRTLSLLSPDRTNFHSFPQPTDVDEPLKPKRANTVKETPLNTWETGYERSIYEPRLNGKKVGNQEALIATGKQMAEDFKEGLWTFIEDLRQATVGEEMAGANGQKQSAGNTPNTTPLKKKGSKASLKLSPAPTPTTTKPKAKKASKSSAPKATKLVDIGDDFWSQLDPDGPLSSKTKEIEEIDYFKTPALPTMYKKGHVKPESVRWSTSTIVSEMGSDIMSAGAFSSPRTSTSSRSRSSSPHRKFSMDGVFPERNAAELIHALADSHPAPWGVISAPLGNLKRTATAVLTHIEKGLAPPPTSQSSYYDLENARVVAPASNTEFGKSKKLH
ncbi:hypothetical protein H072_8575 [Dactylellina haptotyla CBS 200.50]|uniref:DUF4048 domain-containing protein n=1 Tax=Dactylellina haptotyla (strain CBS 200.50) TaxID=1284197 RepID=S8BER7_DACHA|nr:hypothetical protein H072_8575 [Dactylellina haptotyla CBS 200.50]